jgi:signal transduction histidine kinase
LRSDRLMTMDESDRHGRRSLEQLEVGLWEWPDVSGSAQWWSPQYYQLLGFEQHELPSDLAALESLIHPSFQAMTFAALQRALDWGESVSVEHQLLTRERGYRWFRTRGKLFANEHGALTCMAGTVQDIHEYKLAQKASQEAGEQLNAIFKLSQDGFVAFDADSRISFCSPAFQTMTGIQQEAVSGLDERAFLSLFQSCIQTRQACVSLVELLISTTGTKHEQTDFANRAVVATKAAVPRMLELRLQRGQGRVTQMLHIRDVTQELEVERLKSEFLSTAAHELRTPMTSIFGFVSLLLETQVKPEKQRTLLERVHRQSVAMMDIINELLDLARIEAKGGNVLSNAYKYSPGGGEVIVRLESMTGHESAGYLVQVSDAGIGMSADELSHMGERFFRANKSGQIPGTGLGISIVREIMEHMGGSMTVESALGQGTTVSLQFRATAAAIDRSV